MSEPRSQVSNPGSKLHSGYTVTWSDDRREIKQLVTTLVHKRKEFYVKWEDDYGVWQVRIEERNEVGGLAGRWGDV